MRKIILFGSAPCTKADLNAIGDKKGFDMMAIGMDAIDNYRGQIDFVATNHKEDIPVIACMMVSRMEAIGQGTYLLIGPEPWQGVDIVEPFRPPSGSSAITGAFAGVRMGYDRIVLCGCPLTGNAPEGNPYEAFRPGWETHKDVFMGKVKSMSGWTRELLGEPTDEWLNHG